MQKGLVDILDVDKNMEDYLGLLNKLVVKGQIPKKQPPARRTTDRYEKFKNTLDDRINNYPDRKQTRQPQSSNKKLLWFK